jgi:hypothetical protein
MTNAADRPEQGEVLNGWKEIAGHLRVEKTTAQRWEKTAGLPVHRRPGPRGGVYALSPELDRWLQNGGVDQPQPEPTPPPVPTPRRKPSSILVLGGAGLLLAIGVAYALFFRAGIPQQIEVGIRDLTVKDAGGKQVFRYAFPSALLPQYYQDSRPPNEVVWFGPLVPGSDVQTLFNYVPRDRTETGHTLYCFSPRGKVRWQFRNQRVVRDRTQQFSPVYFLSWFHVLAVSGRTPVILAASNHSVSHPEQIAALDADGRILGEYWHSGHLLHMTTEDLDGDGQPELILAGVDNGYERATVVVLDPFHLRGASREPPDSPVQLQDMEPAAEKAVVLFPRSCITERLAPYNRACDVRAHSDGVTVMVTEGVSEIGPFGNPYIVYELGKDLRLRSVDVSDQWRQRHRALEAEGKLDHSVSLRELDRLHTIQVRRSGETDFR